MAKKKVTPATIDEVEDLLAQADVLIRSAKSSHKKKQKAVCKKCADPLKFLYYKQMCKECYEEDRASVLATKKNKRWFSTNGHEYTYDEQGKPVLYARFRMAQIIGRPLTEHEQVARIDGDKRNNADHNLILVTKGGINLGELVCSNCGQHYFRGRSVAQEEQ